MTEELLYIYEHIKEFESYISTESITRIIEEVDIENHSIKYMVRTTTGGYLQDIVILIYRHFLLIGVVIIKNKKIIHQELNNDGIDINNYLPKYLKITDNECKSKQKQIYNNTFLKECDVSYYNTLTTLEKLNLLENYINDQDKNEKYLSDKKENKVKKKIIKNDITKYNSIEKEKEKEKEYKWMLKKNNVVDEEARLHQLEIQKRYYERHREKRVAYQKRYNEIKKIINKNNKKQDENK